MNLNWIAQKNYSLMIFFDNYMYTFISIVFFVGALIKMHPLKYHHELNFIQSICVIIRKSIIYSFFILAGMLTFNIFLYDISNINNIPGQSIDQFLTWQKSLFLSGIYKVALGLLAGLVLRFIYVRYFVTLLSSILRKFRNNQTSDSATDIRIDSKNLIAKTYDPTLHFKDKKMFLGLDQFDKAIYITAETWRELNMQIIGPTRYGKGISIGYLMTQSILKGDSVFYIDPKKDKFAPHLMLQACKEVNRPFIYLSLNDNSIGSWAPFAGGSERDSLSRMVTAFGLEKAGGDSDFYKSQEMKELLPAFSKSRNIEGLKNLLKNSETASRIQSELVEWSQIKSLNPKSGRGVSIEKAIKENSIVYVQGSISDQTIKTATKIFIVELIQESMRLVNERSSHISLYIDEVRFLASKQLADALATVVGFNVNIITAYQSILDLQSPDDKTLDGKALLQSINVNSQLKSIYGGADRETAKWVSETSGTIQKTVTKMEKTDIREAGAETWEKERTVGQVEEHLISENVVLSLPPRISVLIQPSRLARICFSSFVAVTDESHLESFISPKPNKDNSKNNFSQIKNSDATSDLETSENIQFSSVQSLADQLSKKRSVDNKTHKKNSKSIFPDNKTKKSDLGNESKNSNALDEFIKNKNKTTKKGQKNKTEEVEPNEAKIVALIPPKIKKKESTDYFEELESSDDS